MTKTTEQQRRKNSAVRERKTNGTDGCFFFLCFSSYRDPPACGVETVPKLREDVPGRFGVGWLRPSRPTDRCCSTSRPVGTSVRPSVRRHYAASVCLPDAVFSLLSSTLANRQRRLVLTWTAQGTAAAAATTTRAMCLSARLAGWL